MFGDAVKKEKPMSISSTVTLVKKPSKELQNKVELLVKDAPEIKKGWKTYFDLYSFKEIDEALQAGAPNAIKEMDSIMKGWKPIENEVALSPEFTDGGTTYHLGLKGNYQGFEFWYQRRYTK